MTLTRKTFVPLLLALFAFGNSVVFGAAPRLDYGIAVSGISCTGNTFTYTAAWSDSAASGTYLIKLGNQCVSNNQQCTTNSKTSCQASCAKGQCRAQFTSCKAAGAGYLFVTPTNGKGAPQEARYTPPTCK